MATMNWSRFCRSLGLAIGLILLPAWSAANSLDGITVVKLADDRAGQVIKGNELGRHRYLTLYISADGTYASLGDKEKISCMAWAQEGTYTGRSIVFGVAPSAQTMGSAPTICQPFTVNLEDDGAVRLSADNLVSRYGPLEPGAQMIRYSRRHQILLRTPLVALDWALPHYERFTLTGVRLGPLPAVRAGLNPQAEVRLGELQVRYDGARKSLLIKQTPDDRDNWRSVSGVVADAGFIGWPWDAFYASRQVVRLPQRSTAEAFDNALVTRYGPPTMTQQASGRTKRDTYWLFDLAGNQVMTDGTRTDNCLGALEYWAHRDPQWLIGGDIGPWSCSLVVQVRDDGGGLGEVRAYTISTMSGYTAALNHFKWRLGELDNIRSQLTTVQEREVTL